MTTKTTLRRFARFDRIEPPEDIVRTALAAELLAISAPGDLEARARAVRLAGWRIACWADAFGPDARDMMREACAQAAWTAGFTPPEAYDLLEEGRLAAFEEFTSVLDW